MDFSIEPKLQSMLEQIRSFMRDEIYPLERDFLDKPFTDLLPALNEKRNQVKAMGLWSPSIPKEYGGAGISFLEFAHISEELGRSPLGYYAFNSQAPDVGNMELLIAQGTPAQKEKYLRPLVRGDIRSCCAMTEPDYPGSNPVWMGTTATKDGDDYIINGRKWFSTSAEWRIVRGRNGDYESRCQAARTRDANHRADEHAGLSIGAEHAGNGTFGRRLGESRRT